MNRRYTQEETRQLLGDALRRDAERRDAENENMISVLKSGTLPTPEPIVRILVWRGVELHRLMRHHCFWKEHKLRNGFDALVAAALSAHLDLARCDAALSAYANSRDPFEDHVDHTVGNPAQKEVMAFCAAYSGTVDTLRRLKGVRPELGDNIDRLRKDTTGSPEFNFMLDLRRNLSHGSVTVPGWSVTNDLQNQTSSGEMRFNSEELLAFGEWNAESRAYIERAEEGRIAISAVTAICAKGLARLRRDLEHLFFQNRSEAEKDFHNIMDLSRKIGSRQWIKVFLDGHTKKGTDPYPHLHRFFSPEQVREILRRPPHSVEQVEYIISLKAAETNCDNSLRAMLYKLFGVQADIPAGDDPPRLDPPPLGDKWP